MSAAGRAVYPDPSALQRQVDQIVDAPPVVRGGVSLAGPYGGSSVTSPDQAERSSNRRGTTNGNARGNPTDRQRRREWLVQTYRADRDVIVVQLHHGPIVLDTTLGRGQPACRCYRCGRLLTVDTVTVDRIVPGCRGGTYRRDNIRPACGPCNTVTGATTRRKGKRS